MPETKAKGLILLLKKVSERTIPKANPVPVFPTAFLMHSSHFLPGSDSNMLPTHSSSFSFTVALHSHYSFSHLKTHPTNLHGTFK
jgi:hypothetical protein